MTRACTKKPTISYSPWGASSKRIDVECCVAWYIAPAIIICAYPNRTVALARPWVPDSPPASFIEKSLFQPLCQKRKIFNCIIHCNVTMSWLELTLWVWVFTSTWWIGGWSFARFCWRRFTGTFWWFGAWTFWWFWWRLWRQFQWLVNEYKKWLKRGDSIVLNLPQMTAPMMAEWRQRK